MHQLKSYFWSYLRCVGAPEVTVTATFCFTFLVSNCLTRCAVEPSVGSVRGPWSLKVCSRGGLTETVFWPVTRNTHVNFNLWMPEKLSCFIYLFYLYFSGRLQREEMLYTDTAWSSSTGTDSRHREVLDFRSVLLLMTFCSSYSLH